MFFISYNIQQDLKAFQLSVYNNDCIRKRMKIELSNDQNHLKKSKHFNFKKNLAKIDYR